MIVTVRLAPGASVVSPVSLVIAKRNGFIPSIPTLSKVSGNSPSFVRVTVCAVLSPATCEEQHLVFSYAGSPTQCAMAAPPYIAQWIGDHPKWQAVRWRCEYPHPNDKA